MNNSTQKVFRPKKSFGQNFLKNPHIIDRIIEAAELSENETVLEVGPGFGVLTEALVKKAKKVIAIEKDDHLFAALKKKFGGREDSQKYFIEGNLNVIHADALLTNPPRTPYVWVANIPYSITSPLLDHFIRDNVAHLPLRAVLLVQKEVAEKICARPPDMNVLALHVQTFGTAKKIVTVSKNNFNPVPKVDSAIIRIDFDVARRKQNSEQKLDHPNFSDIKNLKNYFDLIHAAFSHKRKMLRGTLPIEILQKAGIDPMRRPETLTIDEWQKINLLK